MNNWGDCCVFSCYMHGCLSEINMSMQTALCSNTLLTLISLSNTHMQTLPCHISLSSNSLHIPRFGSNWNCTLDTLHLVSPAKKVPQDVLETFCTAVRAVLLTVIPVRDYEGSFPTATPPASWEGPIWYQQKPTDQMHHCHLLWLAAIFIWLGHKMPFIKGRITLKWVLNSKLG